MSYYDYSVSRELESRDYPFYALIMAAMRRADSFNLVQLKEAFPNVWKEMMERYNLPGGKYKGEEE